MYVRGGCGDLIVGCICCLLPGCAGVSKMKRGALSDMRNV